MSLRRAFVMVLALVPLVLAPPSVQADDPAPPPVAGVALPAVSGAAAYRSVLTATPGAWDPAQADVSWQWLRDGRPIRDADRARYRLRMEDIGTRVQVRVTARHDGYTAGVADSAPVRVRPATLDRESRPVASGTRRYLRTLTASPGAWEQRVVRRYRWLRDGRPIAGATGRSYRLTHRDVGARVTVEVTASRRGHRADSWRSARPRPTMHRVALRRTVLYRVETRGRLTTSLADFRRLAHASLNDPRGWRAAGIAFRRVSSGGGMSLVLSEASRVPGFHPICSSRWSCRVGRYVVINQDRWKHASPAWNRYGGSLRGYRHMVVNHETGHWLGHGHRGCPASGALAPVMQQQSISLGGCRFNPFPRPGEWSTPRFP